MHGRLGSYKDNLWAVETPVPQGAESPLDVLLPAHGNAAAAEAFWARLRAEAPSRKLGQANALVARSLLLSTDTLLDGEAEAAAELKSTGWVEWVDRVLPGEGSLLRPPRLPAALIAHVRVTPLRPWLEALSAGLAARAAASSERRSASERAMRARRMQSVRFLTWFIFHLASFVVVARSARRTAESAARTWSTETASMGCTTFGSAKEAKRCACSARASPSPYAALLIAFTTQLACVW